MIKNLSLAAALLSLALATGCATGGSGPCAVNCASIDVTNTSAGIVNVNEAPVGGAVIQFTATVSNLSSNTVTWSISPSSCGSACGTLATNADDTATYTSPAAVPASADNPVTITATSQSNPSVTGTFPITIVDVTTSVVPVSPKVGAGLAQEFTALATPDNAQQTFGNWTCTNKNGDCTSELAACSNVTGACMTYTPQSGETSVNIIAAPTSGCGTSNANCTPATPTVVASRVSGTYGFQFSGYDHNGKQVMAAGTFTASASGTGATISGVEDQVSWNGTQYAPSTGVSISGTYQGATNNSGTLKLNGNTFNVVMNGGGDIRLAEADSNGALYGVAEPSSTTNLDPKSTPWNFAFGFTGADSSSSAARVGFAGLLTTDGNGTITSGLMDTNDGGNTSNICGASPCTLTGGTYSASGGGRWSLQFSSAASNPCTGSDTTCQHFDFFVGKGTATASNPLTLYAISTSTVDATHPALLGEVAFQATPTNKSGVYDNSAFNGTSVSALTGVDGNSSVVSLTLGLTDGTSGGANGTGNFAGQFDQNDAGTILTYPAPSTSQSAFIYTYVATSNLAANNNAGRYIFQMLGNPAASPVVAPIPFVLYASGPNRGFLLDQNSTAVMTGTMTATKAPSGGTFTPATITGTYGMATKNSSLTSPASCSLMPSCAIAGNLLLTSPGLIGSNTMPSYVVNGTLNGQTISKGSYNIVNFNSVGGIGSLSATTASGAANYVIYAIDGTDFYVIEEDSKVPSPVLFMSQ